MNCAVCSSGFSAAPANCCSIGVRPSAAMIPFGLAPQIDANCANSRAPAKSCGSFFGSSNKIA